MRDRAKESSSEIAPRSRSEFDVIELIRRRASGRGSSSSRDRTSLRVGIGDDAAVLRQRAGYETIITSDLLVESVDFDLSTTTPEALGHKALAVSLSDIAAMGARPRYSLMTIGVPPAIWNSRFLERLYKGYFELAEKYGIALIGGDVSRTTDGLTLDSIVVGEVAEGAAVLRSGARPGDHIFVTGYLGGAAAGLLLLQRGAKLRATSEKENGLRPEDICILRQIRPEPRNSWALALNKKRLATAVIDISDGLSSDLNHLCRASSVGAVIELSRIPIDPAVKAISEDLGVGAAHLALNGGEDFELLFTVAPRDLKRLPRSVGKVRLNYIGDVTAEKRILLREDGTVKKLTPGGYSHFN